MIYLNKIIFLCNISCLKYIFGTNIKDFVLFWIILTVTCVLNAVCYDSKFDWKLMQFKVFAGHCKTLGWRMRCNLKYTVMVDKNGFGVLKIYFN